MKKLVFAFLVVIQAIFLGCGGNETKQPKDRSLQSYFKKIDIPDTMRFEISENDAAVLGDTLPNGLFFSQIESYLMNHIDYFDNSGSLTVIGRGHFPLTENMEAYLVDMRQNWYQHQSLFLFDQQIKQFTDRVTVAEFYGGDGGQILTGSYLLDYDGDGDKDLVRREIEHWIDVTEEEPTENMAEYGVLLLWEVEGFEEAYADSVELVEGFPIWHFWQ